MHRPAAVEQLRILGDQVGVPVYTEEFEVGRGDAVKIAQNGVRAASDQKADLVIVDTAGRQVVDADLMRELRDARRGAEDRGGAPRAGEGAASTRAEEAPRCAPSRSPPRRYWYWTR